MTNDGVSLGQVGDDTSIRIFKEVSSNSKEVEEIKIKLVLLMEFQAHLLALPITVQEFIII